MKKPASVNVADKHMKRLEQSLHDACKHAQTGVNTATVERMITRGDVKGAAKYIAEKLREQLG